MRVTVVGGINRDFLGRVRGRTRPADSNPGVVSSAPGGVGHNIALALRQLGCRVRLAAPLGDDDDGAWLLDALRREGIVSLCPVIPGARSGAYLALEGADGELIAAVNDMDICERMRGDLLRELPRETAGEDAVVLDANLPCEALSFLAGALPAPLAADPVSAAKAPRLTSILPRLRLLKPNVPEAEALTGLNARAAGPAALARALARMGVARVFLTLGAAGVYYLGADGEGALPCPAGDVISTNGCGDAFLAASLEASLAGVSTREAAAAGLCAAALRAAGQSLAPQALREALNRYPL